MIVSLVGPHDERLFELARGLQSSAGLRLETMMRDDRALLREPFDVLRFLLEERERDEEREVRVHVAGVLEHPVQRPLDVFPDAVAPRLDHHAPANRGIFRHVGGLDHLLVPLRVVVASRVGVMAVFAFWGF